LFDKVIDERDNDIKVMHYYAIFLPQDHDRLNFIRALSLNGF